MSVYNESDMWLLLFASIAVVVIACIVLVAWEIVNAPEAPSDIPCRRCGGEGRVVLEGWSVTPYAYCHRCGGTGRE